MKQTLLPAAVALFLGLASPSRADLDFTPANVFLNAIPQTQSSYTITVANPTGSDIILPSNFGSASISDPGITLDDSALFDALLPYYDSGNDQFVLPSDTALFNIAMTLNLDNTVTQGLKTGSYTISYLDDFGSHTAQQNLFITVETPEPGAWALAGALALPALALARRRRSRRRAAAE